MYHGNAGRVDNTEEISEKAVNLQMDSALRWFHKCPSSPTAL